MGYCLVGAERGSAEAGAWPGGGQRGTQASGGPSTPGPGGMAAGGRAGPLWDGAGRKPRQSSGCTGYDQGVGGGRSVGGASNICVGGAKL